LHWNGGVLLRGVDIAEVPQARSAEGAGTALFRPFFVYFLRTVQPTADRFN